MPNRDLKTRFTGDTSDLQRATSDAERAIKGTESTFSTSAKNMAKVGAGIAAGFAIDFALEQVTASVGIASDLAESMNKVDVAFGESADSMKRFIENANSIGLSDRAASALAGNLGVLGGQLGLADAASASMAESILTLGADLGSFNNLGTEDVVERIQKAMTGELDGMRALTPALNAAAVEQRALADSGKATADELTAQERAMATLALITEQSSDAMGDFTETSDSAANQQKILSSEMEDMQASLGEKLLPLWESFQRILLEDVLPALETFGQWIAENIPPIYEEYLEPVFTAAGELIRSFVELGMLLWEQFGQHIVRIAQNYLGTLLGIVRGLLDALRGVIQVVTALIKGDWAGVWEGLKRIASGVFAAVRAYVSGFLEHVRAIFGVVADVLSAPFEKMRDAAISVFNAIARAWNNTVGKLEFKAPDWVPGIGGKGFEVPNIPTVGARLAPMMAPLVVNMPAGTDGYSLVTTLRSYERVGGSLDTSRVAVA
jgi:hypothetical protein